MLPNSTFTSILKSPTSEKKGLKVRFEMADDITVVIKEYCEGSNKSNYITALNHLNKGEIDTVNLVNWLKQLRENISLISHQSEGLVSAILKINWMKHEDAIPVYESFILNLLSAHTTYLKMVLRSLIDKFMPNSSVASKSTEKMLANIGVSSAEEKIFCHIHKILQNIIKIVPMAPLTLMPLIAECFPYMRKEGHLQACYIYNLLSITKYLPAFRRGILEIIIDKMIKIDVYCPKQEILDAESDMADEENAKRDGNDDQIFEMEISNNKNDEKLHDDDDDVEMEKESENCSMAHGLANILDVTMQLLFSYIREACYAENNLDWDSTKKLYKELLFIFNKLILPTHACCHIQFVMFYICSFRSALCDGFLDYLWKRITDPNTPPILRQSAVSYIGSYLARAAYIPVSTVTACFDVMCGWLHRYIDAQDNNERSYPDVSFHGPFFSVCQSLFYVFAFRHKDLLEMPHGFRYLQSLNFDRIVTSCLNPLRFCLPAVVRNFASIARNCQLAYCYTIIEKNNRTQLQIVSRNPAHAILSTKNALDSFFPFDPYLLIRSSKYVVPIYREYQGPLDDEPVENNETYDVILEAHQANIAVSPVNLPEFLLYGSSPGFKHSIVTKSSLEAL